METAAKILTIGGLGNLTFAFVFGFVLSRARMRDPEADESLLTHVHIVSLWEGFMLLGLVFGVTLSSLSSGLESLAAWLLVAASLLQAAAAVVAWRGKVTNLFGMRGPAYQLAAVNAVLAAAGIVILLVGALQGL